MIGFIGGGNMAEAIIKGIVQSSKFKVQNELIVSEPIEDRRKYLAQTYGIKTTSHNKEVASACNIIILAVKPQNMDSVLDEIADEINDKKTVVSIAAGITLSYLGSRLKTKQIIRVMPNTPALVQEGMSVMSLCGCFFGREVNIIKSMLMSVGRVLTLPEEQMNAVTALSGSGPAFIALFIEAMVEGGEKMGLSKADAAELAVQTLIGTAKLLETGMSAERLRQVVTSPGGTTAAGLKVFNERDLADIVKDALHAAQKRAEELGRKG
ncbi:MAG: pyrroline-5-carboxylate reductase [Nitrospirota bacterium]